MCGPGVAENRKCARHCSEKQIFEGPANGEHSKLRQNPAGWDPIRSHFGVTLPTLELLWEHFGYIKVVGIILVRFRKTHVSPLDFNDFIQFKSQLGGTFGSFGVILGL